MYGGTSVTYTPPPPDNSFEKYLEYVKEKDRILDDRAAAAIKAQDDANIARKTAGAAAYSGLKQSTQQQLAQGLIDYKTAANQLRDYAAKYDMTPPEADIQELTTSYTASLPGKRATGIQASFEELLGRSATPEELAKSQERFQQGYYSSFQDLKDSLSKSPEYTKKFNQSYLANYYDTMYGNQTVDEKGEKTGQRTFKFASNLLPKYASNLEARTKITIPQFGESFTGTPAEIEEQTQNIRDTRQFLYSSGLTNLQGEIDKETQKLKNEGTKEVTKIASAGSLYSNLVSGFWG